MKAKVPIRINSKTSVRTLFHFSQFVSENT